jgi:hypothetical protein
MNGMFNSTILDVVVGLIFIYLLLAVICSSINEWIARWTNLRAKNLKDAIRQLLDKQPGSDDKSNPDSNTNWFLHQFYSHPLITGMHVPGQGSENNDPTKTPQSADAKLDDAKGHPSYLPSRAFATVVMDIITPANKGAISFDDLQRSIEKMPAGDVRRTLLAVIQNADQDIHRAQKNIETWYDDTMERVGGWYKSKTQVWTVLIAAALTIAANADTVRIAHTLWVNPTQRAQMVESAKRRAANSNGQSAEANHQELAELDNLLGWGNEKNSDDSDDCLMFWLKRLLGWFLTIIAVSLGAPFWFDLLNKIVNLRNSGKKPETAEQNAASAPPRPAAPPAAKTTPATS